MTAIAELPTLREELDRKTLETIQWLVRSTESGAITGDQLSVAVDTLFMAVSGLVDADFINMFTELQAICPTEKQTLSVSFYRETKVLTFDWTIGALQVHVSRRDALNDMKVDTQKTVDFDEACKARAYWDNLPALMSKSGFERL
jgi:hypothetical protein